MSVNAQNIRRMGTGPPLRAEAPELWLTPGTVHFIGCGVVQGLSRGGSSGQYAPHAMVPARISCPGNSPRLRG